MEDQRIKNRLKSQLRFIEASCKAFDEGHVDEAQRISNCLRIIFHNKGRSVSILAHLEKEDINLLSSAGKTFILPGVIYMELLVRLNTGTGVHPKLDSGRGYKELSFNEWWNMPVLIYDGINFSRKLLTLYLAEQDGGSHVDSKLNKDYSILTKGIYVSEKFDKGKGELTSERIENTHYVHLRQIAWEVLNSPELLALTE
jgi:hypothetical protein